MTARDPDRPYHHGDLEAAARKAALALVEAEGGIALSMRKVAAAAGVAHRALYNHFDGREGLLDAVAIDGYDALAGSVADAATREEFIAAYLRFGLARPHLYALMMSRPHATMPAKPPLQAAVHRVIARAFAFFADPDAPSAANRRRVMRVYVLLHGALSLRQAGILDVPDDAAFIADMQAMAEGL